jgi:endonuclease/exonuclease/phosphatase family metal-dependent hydrolase
MLVAWLLFFLTIFWTCLAVPVSQLSPQAAGDKAYIVADQLYQPLVARNRSAQGLVSVISYNFFLRPDLITDIATRAQNDFKEERLTVFLERLDDYDILLLQEVWPTNGAGRYNRLMQNAHDQGFRHHVRAACKGKVMSAMLLILSRHPLVAGDEHTFTQSIGQDAMATKGVVFARALINGEADCAVDLFVTHLQAGMSGSGGHEVRANSTREVGTFVRSKLSERRTTAIIAGDFNIHGRTSDDSDVPSDRYYELLDNLAFGVDSGFTLTNLLDNGHTIPVTAPQNGDLTYLPENVTGGGIDYAFFVQKRDMVISEQPSRVLPYGSAVVDRMLVENRDFVTLSDHFAVVLMLQCRPL